MSSAMVADGPTTMANDTLERSTDERRAKALEEHRRLMKEHRDKESKLRECTSGVRCWSNTHMYVR